MTIALTDTRIFANGTDFTTLSNKVELAPEVAELDATTFGTQWDKVASGLHSGQFSIEGYWDPEGSTDGQLFTNLGTDVIHTVCPATPAVGDLAWLFKSVQSKYTLGGSIGELVKFTGGGKINGPIARGAAMHPPGTARTTTGSGTGVQLGAVSATQRMFCNLHVLSVAGTSSPTITVKLQSDEDNTFGSPTDRVTFSAAGAVGAQASSVAGAITDTWWRVVWTITGSSPSFLFVASAGIATR